MTQNILTAGNATSNQSLAAGDDGTFKIVVGPNGSQVNALAFDASGNATVAGGVLSKGTSGLGYGTGAGGMVTQATSKGTAVSLNTPTGQITMNNAALAAGGRATFVCNNSLVASTDTVVLNLGGGSANPDDYLIRARMFSGGFTVSVINQGASGLAEAIVINFAIIKGATS